MTVRCDAADVWIEALAAGEPVADPAVDAHIQGCARCSRALAIARDVDDALRAPSTPAPQAFVSRVMARVRHDQWKAEQQFDLAFNVAIAVGIAAVVGGVWMLMNLSGLTVVTSAAGAVLLEASADVFRRMAGAAPTYAAAVSLLVTAAGVWWWAEQRFI